MIRAILDLLVRMKVLKIESAYKGTGDRDLHHKNLPNIKLQDAEFKVSRLIDWRYLIRTDMYTFLGRQVFKRFWTNTEYIDWMLSVKAELYRITLHFGLDDKIDVERRNGLCPVAVRMNPDYVNIFSANRDVPMPEYKSYTVPFDKYTYKMQCQGTKEILEPCCKEKVEGMLEGCIKSAIKKMENDLEDEVVKINEEITGIKNMGIPSLKDGSELALNLICRKHRVPVFHKMGNPFSICPVCGPIRADEIEYLREGINLTDHDKYIINRCVQRDSGTCDL